MRKEKAYQTISGPVPDKNEKNINVGDKVKDKSGIIYTVTDILFRNILCVDSEKDLNLHLWAQLVTLVEPQESFDDIVDEVCLDGDDREYYEEIGKRFIDTERAKLSGELNKLLEQWKGREEYDDKHELENALSGGVVLGVRESIAIVKKYFKFVESGVGGIEEI